MGGSGGRNIEKMTWEEFLLGLQPFHVRTAKTLRPVVTTGKQAEYLVRDLDDEEPLVVHMPLKWSPLEKVGSYRVDNICKRLEIDPHIAFPGWYFLM